MAVGTITPVDPRRANGALAAPAAATATDGDNIPMLAGKTYLVRVNNGSGGAITVDIDDPASGAGGTPEYNDVSIANGASRNFTFKRPQFGKMPSDNVLVVCSGVSSVTIEAYGPMD